jgi:hypothetical protein
VSTPVEVVFDPGTTNATSDDSWTVRYKAGATNFEQSYTNLAPQSDLLGQFRTASAAQNGLSSRFTLYDTSAALTSALKYVSIASYQRTLPSGAQETFFMPIGQRTPSNLTYLGGTADYHERWLGLFGQVNRFYKWVTAAVMPQPGLVGAG